MPDFSYTFSVNGIPVPPEGCYEEAVAGERRIEVLRLWTAYYSAVGEFARSASGGEVVLRNGNGCGTAAHVVECAGAKSQFRCCGGSCVSGVAGVGFSGARGKDVAASGTDVGQLFVGGDADVAGDSPWRCDVVEVATERSGDGGVRPGAGAEYLAERRQGVVGSVSVGTVLRGQSTLGGAESPEGDALTAGSVSLQTQKNRERRIARKERKKKRKAAGVDCRESCGLSAGSCNGREGRVPEWRVGAGPGVGFFSKATPEVQARLRDTRAARLAAENELKTFEAKRKLELEQAKDLNQLKKRQETQILRETEVNKVQVEKAFAQLAGSGNVPGVRGFAETVVSGNTSSRGNSPVFSGAGSGSISPNSSISLKEIHEMQKESLRLQAENKELNETLAALKELNSFDYAKVVKPKKPETVDTGYSVDSSGQIRREYLENIEDISDLVMEKDGKYHYRPGSFDSNWCDNFD